MIKDEFNLMHFAYQEQDGAQQEAPAQESDFYALLRNVVADFEGKQQHQTQADDTVDDFFNFLQDPQIKEETQENSMVCSSASSSPTYQDPSSPTASTLSDDDARDFASLLEAIPSSIKVRSCKHRHGKFDDFTFNEIKSQDLASMQTSCKSNAIGIHELLTTSCQFAYVLETNDSVKLSAELVCLLDNEKTPIALTTNTKATLSVVPAYDLSIKKSDPNRKMRVKLFYALRLFTTSGEEKLYGPFVLACRPPKKSNPPIATVVAVNVAVAVPKLPASKRQRESDPLGLREQ